MQKVKIGRVWQQKTNMPEGRVRYLYYMVFRNKDLHQMGAVHFDRFMEIVRGLLQWADRLDTGSPNVGEVYIFFTPQEKKQ